MKVVQINSMCGRGSTGKIAVDILSTLRENGGEGKIIYGRETAPAGIEALRFNSDADIRLHGVLSRLTDSHGLHSSAATRRMVEFLREYDPDIIHLHNIHGYYLNYEILFRYLIEAGKPVVWTLHDCWSFTGHCAGCGDCHGFEKACEKCGRFRRYPKSLFFSRSKRNFALKKELFTALPVTLVTPSQWLAGEVRRSFLAKQDIRVINNGIDLSVFHPTPSGFSEKCGAVNKKIVLGVAFAWGKIKGLEDFERLAGELGDEYQVVLVGLSTKQKQKVSGRIYAMTRTKSASELAEIYTAADVFVNPTYQDNFPTVNIEALACGTPYLTYKTGGSPEALAQGCGSSVDTGDVEALASEIRRLCSAEKNSDCCIERGKQFDKHLKFREYIELYEQLSQGN